MATEQDLRAKLLAAEELLKEKDSQIQKLLHQHPSSHHSIRLSCDSGPVTSTEVDASDMCEAAAGGDIERLRGLVSKGADLNQGDYDRRTALHLAASEGLLPVLQYLLEEAKVDANPVDRWGACRYHFPAEVWVVGLCAYLRNVLELCHK